MRNLAETNWTDNPTEGVVIGIIIEKPTEILGLKVRSAQTTIIDSGKRKWRVRTSYRHNPHLASQLLGYEVGQKLKITGVTGELCRWAWGNAKRQIIPDSIEVK